MQSSRRGRTGTRLGSVSLIRLNSNQPQDVYPQSTAGSPAERPQTAFPDGSRSYAASGLQRAVFGISQFAPRGGHYLQQLICDWNTELNLEIWIEAWRRVAARLDALRQYVRWNSSAELRIHFATEVEIPVSVRAVEPQDRERFLEEYLARDRRAGFDLSDPPLWRLAVFDWGGGKVTTLWTFHHGLLDGRSHAAIWKEVASCYAMLNQGGDPVLPEAKPFREFLDWLENQPAEPGAGYWRQRLEGFHEAFGLPTRAVAKLEIPDDGPPAHEQLEVDPAWTASLRSAADRHGVTLNNLCQAAWALLLARYNDSSEVTFGAVRAGRHWTQEEPNRRVGLFINTIPFRVSIDPLQSAASFLREVFDQQKAARAGEHASLEDIRAWTGIPSNIPLFKTAFMFENSSAAALAEDGQRIALCEKTDLVTLAVYAGKSLTLVLDYLPSRHSAAQIRKALEHLQLLLAGFGSCSPEDRIGAIGMYGESDQKQIFGQWQGQTTPEPADPIHRVLEARAVKTLDAPAVEWLNQSLSYSALHARANQLARRMLEIAVPGDRVMVVLDRHFDQIISWLALLKAGLIYVPIDPSTPRDRLAFLLEDIRPVLILTHEVLLPLFPREPALCMVLDSPEEHLQRGKLEVDPLDTDPTPEAAISLLYTSGSTGVPKAAINCMGGLSNFAAELRRSFDFGPADRVLQSSATSFDGSIFDFVAALQSGATLVLVPPDQLLPGPRLSQALTDLRISVVLLTPTTLRATPPPAGTVARWVLPAGETLHADLVLRWAPGRRLVNVCGPTECSVWYTAEECQPDGFEPTIGRPVLNCRVYILDANKRPVPVGVPGELYLGGAGVGGGYWNGSEPDCRTPSSGSLCQSFRRPDVPDGRPRPVAG